MSCKYLAVVAGILVLGAMPAFAHTVTLTADCTEFTIEASNFGTGTVVSYTITLIPSSGSNITVSGSITSDSGPQTTKWADVGVTLNGDYTLSLSTNPSPADEVITITPSPPSTLNCHPAAPQLTVSKSPKDGTFAFRHQVSFTIIVGNPGESPATNVTLNDQLPGNGGLSFISVTTTQGTCTLSTTNLLSCTLEIRPETPVSGRKNPGT